MRLTSLTYTLPMLGFLGVIAAAETAKYDYRLLATTKTSTMEKELNQAAEAGYSFSSVMGGQTGMGEGSRRRNGQETRQLARGPKEV